MRRSFTQNHVTEMRRQLSGFLTRNLDNPRVAWPAPATCTTPHVAVSGRTKAARSATGLRVLVAGELLLEQPVWVDVTRARLVDTLRFGGDVARLPSRASEVRVGGFVANAARAARTLGATVSVCATVPAPIPDPVDRFLTDHTINRRFLTESPGRCPFLNRIYCTDGQVAIRCANEATAPGLRLPCEAAMEADVILADPCCPVESGVVFRAISECLLRRSRRPVVGLRLRCRGAPGGHAPIDDDRVWTFIHRRDAQRMAGRLDSPAVGGGEESLAKCLQERGGVARLVLLLGSRGAVLKHGARPVFRAPTCPVDSRDVASAGDTLLAVTTLSSASGADARTSLRRGVAAATGQAASLELPRSFEGLDDP